MVSIRIEDEIQDALKGQKAILGYRQSIKFIKLDEPKLVVIAKNIPESMKKEIEHNAKVSNVRMEVFEGSSKDLGVICGKPYPVSIVVIKG
jgi:large subunit ribosomal protein L30e